MKKLLTLFTMLLLCIGSTWAQDGTVVATMSDLISGAAFNNAKTVKENSIYSFSYNTYIGAIANSAVKEAYEGGGYVTVAMWVWGNTGSGCLFGYGEQGTGIKASMNGTVMKMTTKNVQDVETVDFTASNMPANQWNLVAFAFSAQSNTTKQGRYYVTGTDGKFWTKKQLSAMNVPSEGGKKCAIGSGNQGSARETFTGRIANVTVIQSSGLLNNSRIATLVGAAPSSDVWYKPLFGGRTWTWNQTNSNYDASDGTASTTTPERANGLGPVYRFNNVGTVSATSGTNVDTSDGGGVWVAGTQSQQSAVTVGLGRWAGSIDVEPWQVAKVSYSVDLKGTEPDGYATVWVGGTLNINERTTFSMNDGNSQRWFIGENGIVRSQFTSVSKGSRNWDFQIVVANDPQKGDADTRITALCKRRVMTWGANISSNINSARVFFKADDGTLTELTTDNDPNFAVSYDAGGMTVAYTCKSNMVNTDDIKYYLFTSTDGTTYTGGAGTSASRVLIAHNGGSATLSGATYYLNQSHNATQTTVNFDDATVDYGDALGIGTAIYNINNTTITTPKFITSQGGNGRSAVVNLTGTSRINVTGSTNADSNTSSIMIGHWNGSSSVTLSDNAQISAPDAQLLVGKTGNTQTITLNGSSNITAKGIKAASNASGTNTLNINGGSLTLGEVGITSYSDSRQIAVNVNGDATITATASTLPITQPVTIAAGKTLTIDGGASHAKVTIAQTPTLGEGSSIHFVNTTFDFNDVRDLSAYTYTFSGCTARFIETGAEYSTGNFTVTNVPDGITILVKKYDYKSTDDTEYCTATKTGTTATLSHEVGVSGSAAWLDYTFDTDTNPTGENQYIQNQGNAGTSDQNLTLDTGYKGNNSFNDDGTLKVKSTPWRNITWPTDYTVAVSANFPDKENACLMAFGSSTDGSQNYLALVRGASSDEIKLVNGHGNSTRFTEVATMSAENATASPHLVVFTKRGRDNVFNVYLDGVNVTQTTYSDALGTGFQVGSLHGGVRASEVAVGGGTGLLRVNDTGVPNEAVFAKAVRVYDYVISDAQMEKLKDEFPYISKGGSYSRTITENGYLSASGAWYNKGSETNVDLPTDAEIERVTYHPDVEITTSADATLTVNADMNTRNIEFGGSNTLTIAGDGTHHLKVYGSVTANSPVIVRYGSADFSTVPVSVGASGSICFDFSAYDFSSVDETTQYVVTGNTSDYGGQISATYPTDQNYLYTLAHNAEQNKYILTVAPNIAAKQQQAIDAVTPYYNGNHVGTGVGKYTVKLGETSYREMLDFGTAVMAWQRLSDCVEPTITINQPTSGYYMLKSKYNEATGYYLQCENQSGKAKQTTDTDEKNIFYITVDESNSTIKSYKTGYYFGQNTYANYTGNTDDPVTWTFSEGSNKGTYTMQSSIRMTDVGTYLFGWSGENDKTYVDRNSSPTTNGHTDWILVPVEAKDLPVIEAPGSTDKNKKILGHIQTVEDVKGKITAEPAFVDLSEATITGTDIDAIKVAVAEDYPNAIIIAPQGTVPGSATTNVLLKADEGKYTCNNLQLTDDVVAQFNTKYVFTTGTTVNYTRASDNQWGTICLPYAVSTDGDVAYYRFVAPVGNQTLRFEKVTDPTTTAKEPYLIKKGTGEGFVVGTTAVEEFSLGDGEVQSTEEHNTYKLQGVMVSTSVINGTSKKEAKEGYQQAVIDPNAYYFDASSNTFRKLNGRFNLKAFRAYLTKTGTSSADDSSSARSILGIDISEDGQSTGISFVESKDGKTVDVVFDLNGRRLQEARKGINIINGKKVIK